VPGVGTNRFGYSANDPVNLRDPGGNEVILTDPLSHKYTRPSPRTLPFGGGSLGALPSSAAIAAAREFGRALRDAMNGSGRVVVANEVVRPDIPEELEEALGQGEDVSASGAAEVNTERDKPFGEAVQDIEALGGTTLGSYETEWGLGKLIDLNGIKISIRPGSKSGGPTIEITDADGVTEKNRYPNELKENLPDE